MNTINIPRSFSIFGELHKVKLLKQVNSGKDYGEYDPNTNIIKIEKASGERNQDQIESTYMHELVHCALHHISEDELYKNEVFVDLLAKALCQAFKTAKY